MSWTSLSSPVNFRFSRMSVRSTSFFSSSTRRSTSAGARGGASGTGVMELAYAGAPPWAHVADAAALISDPPDFADQRGQVGRDDGPDDVVIHRRVAVDQAVPHSYDL